MQVITPLSRALGKFFDITDRIPAKRIVNTQQLGVFLDPSLMHPKDVCLQARKVIMVVSEPRYGGWDDPVASQRGYVLLAGHFAEPVRHLGS
jgi:hypothetical protein